jgi:hypothetical protein
MSTEMHVLFRGKLPDRNALSHAMTECGFPFTIAAGSLERQHGFMPMRLRRQATGVEFDVFSDRAAVEELAGKDIDPALERSANFRWSGDEHEMLAGICAAAALAKLVNGIVLDESDGNLLSPDEAIALAREYLQQVLKPESGPQRKVRALKHYLKPLLQQRQDLVLVGRLLVIRPIRHIVRGALFEKIDQHFPSRIWRFMYPLFHPREHTIRRASLCVWEPHFEPLLMDVLANEIFDSVGQITSIGDFMAESPELHWGKITRALALLLLGRRESAATYVDNLESRDPNNSVFRPWYAKLREYTSKTFARSFALSRKDASRQRSSSTSGSHHLSRSSSRQRNEESGRMNQPSSRILGCRVRTGCWAMFRTSRARSDLPKTGANGGTSKSSLCRSVASRLRSDIATWRVMFSRLA